MRNLRRLVLASVLTMALVPMTGCTRLFKLSPETDASTDRIFIAGDEWAVVEDANARVAIAGEKVSGSEIYLQVSVQNKSDKRFDFLPEEIRVWAQGGDSGKRPLKVWSPSRYMADLRGSQNTSMFISALADGLSRADEGRKTATTTTTGSAQSQTYGGDPTYKRERYAEKSVTVIDDPAARRAAEERDRQRYEQQAARNAESNQRLDSALLKATTLFKGDKIQGLVIVEAADASLYTVSVMIGDTAYRVRFRPKD